MKKAFIQLHIAVFLAGFTGIMGRLIHLDAGWLVWYRLLITSATMWVLFFFTGKLKSISLRDKLKLAGVGFMAAMHWVTFYGSIQASNISVALVCFSSVGFFTALFEPLLLKTAINKAEVILGLVVMAAIALILRFDPQYKYGILLGVACALLLAVNMIWLRQFISRINPETVLTWQLSGGFLSLSAIMPFYVHYFKAENNIPGYEDWLWLLALAWICSVIAFQLTAYSLKKLSAFTVNLTFNLEPVYGILLAFAVYRENEQLSLWFYIGFAMIAASLIIHTIMLIKAAQRKKLKDAIDGLP